MAANTGSVTLEYTDLPAVMVFADTPAAGETARDAVVAAGGRVSASLPIADAAERIENQARLAAVVAEVSGDADGDVDALFEQLDAGARAGRFASVVTIPRDLIDLGAARLWAESVTLLCEPTAADRSAAIATALESKRSTLLSDSVGLKELADEVARIAKTLATLASEDNGRASDGAGNRAPNSSGNDAALLRAMIRARRLRGQFFPEELFADPAWDMLLDLAAAKREGRAVAVSSLCIASAVPPTTALRWIKTLTDCNLFRRVADNSDGRRVFIELTDAAQDGMAAYLAAIQRMAVISV